MLSSSSSCRNSDFGAKAYYHDESKEAPAILDSEGLFSSSDGGARAYYRDVNDQASAQDTEFFYTLSDGRWLRRSSVLFVL